MRLKIAIFSKIPVFPPYGGNRARVLTMCDALRAAGCDLSFYLIASRQLLNADLPAHQAYFGGERFTLLGGGLLDRVLTNSKIAATVLSRKITARHGEKVTDVDYLLPVGLDAQVRRIARERQYDAVIAEYVHFSRVLTHFPDTVFKVLDTHDSFHAEFTSQAEARGFGRADRVLAIQEQEATSFRSMIEQNGHKTDVQLLSHFLHVGEPLSVAKSTGGTFFGSSFAANVVSIRYLIDAVMPLVWAREPDFKLVVAGSICQDIEDAPGIVKLGTVAKIADAFRDAPILLNSIRAGTGVKIKLLDAMALGLPIVSTKMGVLGLDGSLLNGTLVADDEDASGFAAHVVQLYRDGRARAELGGLSYRAAQTWSQDQDAQLRRLCDDIRTFRAGHGAPLETPAAQSA